MAGIACGGGDSGGPPASGRKTVLVVNNEFQPATATISVGDTILWSWQTSPKSVGHNIISAGALTFPSLGTTASPGTLGVDFFDAPASHQVIFNVSGTYEYYCSQHCTTGCPGGATGMQGKVVVNP